MQKRPYKMTDLRDGVRDAVYHTFKEAGTPLTRAEVDKTVYLDTTRNPWADPVFGTVVINYEMGVIPSPAWNEVVDDLILDVSQYVEDDLGKGFFLEQENAAISYLVVPESAAVWLPRSTSKYVKGGKLYTRRRRS